ncbi:hypothetical protein PAXRUDRAFT_164380, partial [Paxillus rubicundulus Ve08.2h10]
MVVDNPTGSAYPNICFWTQTKFNEWSNSPGAHTDKNWKMSFLEDTNSATMFRDTIKAIRKGMCTGWMELVSTGMAPKSWSKACASTRVLFHSMMEKSFPIFKLTHNGWKLDHLCANYYPGWVRNNSNKAGEWLTNKAMKTED